MRKAIKNPNITRALQHRPKLIPSSRIGSGSIMITGTGEGKQFSVITNQFGSYSTFTHLGPGTHKIEAYFAGDSDHTSSSAIRVVSVK